MLIVDAHQDIAWNMLSFGRDYTRSALDIRRIEAGGPTPVRNDDTLLGWPEYQRGRVAVVFATLFAAPQRGGAGMWETLCYADTAQARRLYQSQVDAYERLADSHPDKFRLLRSQHDLQAVLLHWKQGEDATRAESPESPAGHPVGLAMLMEGADCINDLSELEEWQQRGVHIIGPAWIGTRFCGGSREPGPLTPEGFALLEAMADFDFCLDLSHMDEKATLQALGVYSGPIIVSHGNALALLKGSNSNRHLTDRVIQGLLERDGCIGIVPFNGFLQSGWVRGDRRDGITLEHVVAHIDYICQMAGDARHVGIGSDFDGGFGLQSTPLGIDTVADLQKLAPLLTEKGYSDTDVAAILADNWLARLKQALPETG